MFFNKNNASIGIVGLGRFGMALAKRLCEVGKEVLVIDQSESKVKEMRNFTDFCFVVEDFSKEALHETGISNCSTVVVCIGEKIDISILATLNVVSLGVPKVIAKAISAEQGFILEKIGAEVVYPERDMAFRIAKKIVSNDILDYMELEGGFQICEMKVPTRYYNVSIMNSKIRSTYGLNIIAIKRGMKVIVDFTAQDIFQEDDVIIVIGKTNQIIEFESIN